MLCPGASNPNHREVLFLKETDDHIAVWEGPKLNKLKAYETSGIKTVYWLDEMEKVIDEVVNGAERLAGLGYGALIVLIRQAQLGTIIETGVRLDSTVSDDLLTTIFNPRTPLHDQAVIIQGERLVAARCTLPLAEEVEDQRLGTRHRAALGISQESDAVTIVISEESSTISLAIGGVLVRGLDPRELKQRLQELIAPDQAKVAVDAGEAEEPV